MSPLSFPLSLSPVAFPDVSRTPLQYFHTRAEPPATPSRVRLRSASSSLPARMSRQAEGAPLHQVPAERSVEPVAPPLAVSLRSASCEGVPPGVPLAVASGDRT